MQLATIFCFLRNKLHEKNITCNNTLEIVHNILQNDLLYMLLCLYCIPYFDSEDNGSYYYALLPICLTTMSYHYALQLCLTTMPYHYALQLCLTTMPYHYALLLRLTTIPYPRQIRRKDFITTLLACVLTFFLSCER